MKRTRGIREGIMRTMAIMAMLGCGGAGDSSVPTPPAPPAAPSVTAVAVTPGSLQLSGPGSLATLEATVSTTAGVDNAATVAWSSSATAVATVSGSGRTVQVTAVAVGTTTITATSAGRSGTATVTVNEAPRTLSVSVGGTGAGRVTSTPAGIDCGTGSAAGCTAPFAFGAAVTLTANASTGSAFEGWTGACTGTVACAMTMDAARTVQSTFRLLPVPVAAVAVSPSPVTLAPGASTQLSATLRDAAGTALTGRVVTWSSADTMIAAVSSSGLVTARSIGGPVLVTATSEGVRGSSSVRVQSPFITAVSLGLGNTSACAVEATGVTWCWGRNADGQLGIGQSGAIAGPSRVVTTQSFVEVDVGEAHACARTAAGTVYCWGTSEWGTLGDGVTSRSARYAPWPVVGGRVAARLSVTYRRACLVDGAGIASCWGDNVNGYLGVTSPTRELAQPSTMSGGIMFRSFRITGDINSFSGCGIALDGISYCWGDNQYGQVGDSTVNRRSTPARLRNPRVYVDLAPGGFHTCGIDVAGTAWCWGYARDGAVGNGQFFSGWYLEPQAVATTLKFASITAGREHTCALTQDGSAYCWGSNQYGEVGDNSYMARNAPVAVATNVKFSRLVAREYSTCGIATTTVVYCWGFNVQGQLGSGSSIGVNAPSAVPRP